MGVVSSVLLRPRLAGKPDIYRINPARWAIGENSGAPEFGYAWDYLGIVPHVQEAYDPETGSCR